MASDNTVENGETEGQTKKKDVSKRTFKLKDGSYAPRSGIDVTGFKIELLKADHTIEQSLGDFSQPVLAAAAAFGLVTAITNAFGGVGDDPAEAIDAAEDRLATLLSGEWATDRSTGPRTSDIGDAYVRARQDAGKATTEEQKTKFLAMVKELGDKGVKTYLAETPEIDAALSAIRAERATAKATEKAAKAKAAGTRSAFLDD